MAYSLATDHMWKEIKGRVVVLNLDTGKYYSLNSTGSLIWKSLMDDISLEEIVERICFAYEIDKETARQDTKEIINSFQKKKLIVKK